MAFIWLQQEILGSAGEAQSARDRSAGQELDAAEHIRAFTNSLEQKQTQQCRYLSRGPLV